MKIDNATVFPLRIPFTDGSTGTGLMPNRWTHLQIALLRLQTDDGVVGWGEGFSYAHLATTVSAIEELVLPNVVGQSIDDVMVFNRQLQQKLHLHGRYGITQFAISAVDIALWDIAAREKDMSLAQLLNGGTAVDCYAQDTAPEQAGLPTYASLVRYAEPALVEQYTRRAVEEGYSTIKLHEITPEAIEAGRRAAPLPTRLVTDVNCNWSAEQAAAMLPKMKELDLYWVEEPLFPPDSERQLNELQKTFGVSIASGENACTSVEFARLAPCIDFLQPSVTKAGGVSEFLRVCDLAKAHDKRVMPHSPYFGPGYQATLQLMAARPVCELFEYLYIDVERHLDPSIPLPQAGRISLPDKPGIGFEPDPALLKQYSVGD